MVNAVVTAARLVALDWGSTRLRAWLLGHGGAILAERQNGDGASVLAGGAPAFERALAALVGDWLEMGVPVLACGMVGSTHGWREAAYVACPARLDRLHEHLVEVNTRAALHLHIVPGLIDETGATPDVMRGEETQVIGALALRPRLAKGRHVLAHPGTHTKWVAIEDGRMSTFQTAFTGELFALLAGQPNLLPDDWRGRAGEAIGTARAATVVTDYVAGMTDRFAQDEYRRLTDISVSG